jgi:hypothetical protein
MHYTATPEFQYICFTTTLEIMKHLFHKMTSSEDYTQKCKSYMPQKAWSTTSIRQTLLCLLTWLHPLRNFSSFHFLRTFTHTIPYCKQLSFCKPTCLNVSDGRQYDAVRYSKHEFFASDTVCCPGFSKQCFRNQT